MRIILKLLIKLYVNKYANGEIVKLANEDELRAYQFKSSSDVVKVLKSNITIQTLRHFEAKSEQERWMIKGASLALQIIIPDQKNHLLLKLQIILKKVGILVLLIWNYQISLHQLHGIYVKIGYILWIKINQIGFNIDNNNTKDNSRLGIPPGIVPTILNKQ